MANGASEPSSDRRKIAVDHSIEMIFNRFIGNAIVKQTSLPERKSSALTFLSLSFAPSSFPKRAKRHPLICMPLPPLQPVIDERVCVRGDVTIHPSAAIATGVILQADPDSRIEIAAGACLGMGAIVHSSNGTLTIGAGANLGAGVLAIGECSIGENACIGAATTLYNASVAPQQIVAPGSLLGDSGRQVELKDAKPVTPEPPLETNTAPSQPVEPNSHTEAVESEPQNDRESQPSSNGFKPKSSSTEIYGQVHVRQIFTSLFPNSPSLNSQKSQDSAGKSNESDKTTLED